MDLYAYSQIDDLEEIAKLNRINVPRLRGYRLMRDEVAERYSDELEDVEYQCCHDLCESRPFWSLNPYSWECDAWSEYRLQYYCSVRDRKVRWDRIHGWKRKALKFMIKQKKRAVMKQFDTFNKYAGRNDVLYIHARIGGDNWKYFGGDELISQPWFLEKVDDYYDRTYCDIYAKILPVPKDQVAQ